MHLGLKAGILCMPRAPSDIIAAAHARSIVCSHTATHPCQQPDNDLNCVAMSISTMLARIWEALTVHGR